MSTRAEEVAKEAFDLYFEHPCGDYRGMLAKLLSSLPEFQPGRELTWMDIRDCHSMGFQTMAAELNKIRAPKADEHKLVTIGKHLTARCKKSVMTREPNEDGREVCSGCGGLPYYNFADGSSKICDHCHGTGVEPSGRYHDREREDSTRESNEPEIK